MRIANSKSFPKILRFQLAFENWGRPTKMSFIKAWVFSVSNSVFQDVDIQNHIFCKFERHFSKYKHKYIGWAFSNQNIILIDNFHPSDAIYSTAEGVVVSLWMGGLVRSAPLAIILSIVSIRTRPSLMSASLIPPKLSFTKRIPFSPMGTNDPGNSYSIT